MATTSRPSPDDRVTDNAADMAARVRDSRATIGPACTRCGSLDTMRWGWQHGRQRHRCRQCRVTFSDLTATPAAYTKRLELWDAHLRGMHSGRTAPDVARELGVSARTVRRWQRRVIDRLPGVLPRLGDGAVYMVRPTWHMLVAVDDHGHELYTGSSYLAPTDDYEMFLRARLMPGSVIICRDRPNAPLRKAALRVGMEFRQAVPPGTFGPPIDLPARHAARDFMRWVARFRGSSSGHGRSYFHWRAAMRLAQDGDDFVALVLRSWMIR